MILFRLFFTAAAAAIFSSVSLAADEACRLAKRGPSFKNAAFEFAAGSTVSRKPAVARTGRVKWCRELPAGFEFQSLYMHNGDLYAVLTGPAANVLAAYTAKGWLRSPGSGSTEISAILKFSAATGEVMAGTYLTSESDDGRAAAFRVLLLESAGDNLRITSENGWQPRMRNRIPMTCTGRPPFRTVTILTPDLSSAVDASAERCVCCE